MRIEPVSESACIVYLGDQIDEQVADRVQWLNHQVQQHLAEYLVDAVPAYTSLLIHFDPLQISHHDLIARLQGLFDAADSSHSESIKADVVELPVYYGAEVALDLEDIGRHCGLSSDEVRHIHSAGEYRVYALGFSPGFAYLGHTDERIRIPRLATPRSAVPAGSLGIAENQTAIYPSESPGGWQILGRTPLAMIDWSSESLTRVRVGDHVRFRPIQRDEYLDLGGQLP